MYTPSITELRRFVDRRGDLSLNFKNDELRTRIDDGVRDLTIEPYALDGSLLFISDPGHGYLAVPKGHAMYETAKRHESECSRPYRFADGTILLEEDCDAPAFLAAIA